MNEKNASSSDLLQAQQLLKLLMPRPGSAAKEQPLQLEVPQYSRLSAIKPARRVQPDVQVEEVVQHGAAEVEPEPVSQEFASWEECIAWCMSTSRAEAAFAVDSQGFVIASRGRIPSHGFEGAGAELICSIEQMERVAPEAGRILCVDIEFDKHRIIGFVAASDKTPPYVVGLVAPEPLRNETKHKITQQIAKNLPNLD